MIELGNKPSCSETKFEISFHLTVVDFLLQYQNREEICIPMVFNFVLALTSFLKWIIMHKPDAHNESKWAAEHLLIPLYFYHAETSEELLLNPKGFSECGLKALSI